MMSILEDFETWKEFLANRLDEAEQQGMSDKTISNVAHEVGDYLSKNVDVQNSEVSVIKELWNVSSEEEQQVLANAMIKLVKNS